MYPGGPNQFTSLFWIKRRWAFEAAIIDESIDYSIRPYRKRWYEYILDKIFNSSIECSNSTRLTITYIRPADHFGELVGVNTARVLTIAEIYHLEIPKEKIPASVLIETVNLLPELNTLKIRSLLLYEPRKLNSEELLTFVFSRRYK